MFAGAGGLGDGFSALHNGESSPCFRVAAAIEKDEVTRKTLVLRHFYRSFDKEAVPNEYYSYIAGDISKGELQKKHKREWRQAESSALKISLGDHSRDQLKRLIKKRIGKTGKWALIGGPPCQAYSLAGRAKMKNNPDFEKDERHFFYKEYLKVVADHRPPAFVMENVKGLLSARINGGLLFHEIFKELSNPPGKEKGRGQLKYRLYSFSHSGEIRDGKDPRPFVVKAEEFGVPQARHRMFILGVRDDLNIQPSVLKKKEPLAVEEALYGMPEIRSGVSRQKDSDELWKKIITSAKSANWLPSDSAKGKKVKETILKAIKKIRDSELQRSSRKYHAPRVMRKWYNDERLKSLTSHETRSHMESDLYRYLFVSSYGAAFGISPKLSDFPKAILPAHRNVRDGCKGTVFSDRFRVQIKSRVSTTITSHISKDGHYFIHYDPAQCRSLTVREAARLQTFPDNYHFEGGRTAQYHQVGNTIPPFLAYQIAAIVKEILDRIPSSRG